MYHYFLSNDIIYTISYTHFVRLINVLFSNIIIRRCMYAPWDQRHDFPCQSSLVNYCKSLLLIILSLLYFAALQLCWGSLLQQQLFYCRYDDPLNRVWYAYYVGIKTSVICKKYVCDTRVKHKLRRLINSVIVLLLWLLL